ncbi:uncharacterized protein LOC111637442 [Centruroides sculpturatus]|uniref:uncharacterized protein LOC111637442 n=1 Tax=Centruroides sculpturatus TaxID=218467 RepID=UPI000C6D83C7|nr:uncharacterized protein LOC111637442 [Centruroides sculpturatus]
MRKLSCRFSKRINDPWIIQLFRSFKPEELQERSFGTNCCRVLENIEFCEEFDAHLMLITDGEYAVRALFTTDSVEEFHRRENGWDPSHKQTCEIPWTKKILLLEDYRIIHRMTCGKYGELMLKVNKFMLIRNYLNMLEVSSFMNLEHLNRDPVVLKKCQDIWENKQLNADSESLQLDLDSFSDFNSQKSASTPNKKTKISLENVTSAKSFLVISEKEQDILNSIPGWNEERKASYTKSREEGKVNYKADEDSFCFNSPIVRNINTHLINHNSKCESGRHNDKNSSVRIHNAKTCIHEDENIPCNCFEIKQNLEKKERQLESLHNNHISNSSLWIQDLKLPPSDKICDETNSGTAKSNSLENNLVQSQISIQSEEENEICSQEHFSDNFGSFCNNHKSTYNHVSLDFKKQCIHSLMPREGSKKKRAYSTAANSCTSLDNGSSLNKRIRNSLTSIFEDEDDNENGMSVIINHNIQWKFSIDCIRTMRDKFTELYLQK